MVNGTPESQSLASEAVPYTINCPRLPLAVYREVVAHLRQVEGVEADLLPQTSSNFDYQQSQVGGLWIRYAPEVAPVGRRRVEQILAYYGDRYGAWQVVIPSS